MLNLRSADLLQPAQVKASVSIRCKDLVAKTSSSPSQLDAYNGDLFERKPEIELTALQASKCNIHLCQGAPIGGVLCCISCEHCNGNTSTCRAKANICLPAKAVCKKGRSKASCWTCALPEIQWHRATTASKHLTALLACDKALNVAGGQAADRDCTPSERAAEIVRGRLLSQGPAASYDSSFQQA